MGGRFSMQHREHLPPPVLTAIRLVNILKRQRLMNCKFGRLPLTLVTTLAVHRAITTVKQTACIRVRLLSKQQVAQHQMQSVWVCPIPTRFTPDSQQLVDLRRHRMPRALHGRIPITANPTGSCLRGTNCMKYASGHETST